MARTSRPKKRCSNNLSCPLNPSALPLQQCCFEGGSLRHMLHLIKREMESVRVRDANLPENFWFKQQFAIGVNDVTRVLERMAFPNHSDCKSSSISLQAILLACDCNPRLLTKHIPNLASSRKVPLILLKDEKEASVRLGELVNLRTTIAIGVKVKGTSINDIIDEIICGKIGTELVP